MLWTPLSPRPSPSSLPTLLKISSDTADIYSVKSRFSLAQFDGLIAATAQKHGLTLVARDVGDFRNLGRSIVDPWDARSLEPHWPEARE